MRSPKDTTSCSDRVVLGGHITITKASCQQTARLRCMTTSHRVQSNRPTRDAVGERTRFPDRRQRFKNVAIGAETTQRGLPPLLLRSESPAHGAHKVLKLLYFRSGGRSTKTAQKLGVSTGDGFRGSFEVTLGGKLRSGQDD